MRNKSGRVMIAGLSILVLVLSVFDGSALSSARQDAPGDKSFLQWSKQDAERILNGSPWAITHEVRIRYAGQARPAAGNPNPTSGSSNLGDQNTISSAGAEAPVDFLFTLRLRSALPVRQALVRLKQIEAKYGKLNDKERAAFDVQNKGLLECPACTLNYVLSLSSKSTQNPGADAVFSLYKGGRLDDLQRYVYLVNDRGERRQLIHFVAPKVPGDEAIFFFPRFNDENLPLLRPGIKGLTFNLTDNEVNVVTNFKIDVTKLVVDGEIQF